MKKANTQTLWLGITAIVAIIGLLLLFTMENITGNAAMPKMTLGQWLQQADKELSDAGSALKPSAKLLTQVQINKGVQLLKKAEYSIKSAEKEASKIKGPSVEQKNAILLLKKTSDQVMSARTKITKAGTLGLANKQKKHYEGYKDLQDAIASLKKVRAVIR